MLFACIILNVCINECIITIAHAASGTCNCMREFQNFFSGEGVRGVIVFAGGGGPVPFFGNFAMSI